MVVEAWLGLGPTGAGDPRLLSSDIGVDRPKPNGLTVTTNEVAVLVGLDVAMFTRDCFVHRAQVDHRGSAKSIGLGIELPTGLLKERQGEKDHRISIGQEARVGKAYLPHPVHLRSIYRLLLEGEAKKRRKKRA